MTNPPPTRHWQPSTTVPNSYSRTMTGNELTFLPSLGWSLWTSIRLTATAPLSTSLDFTTRARAAWRRISYQQPQLAATFDFTSKIVTYTCLDDVSSEHWLENTFIVHEDEEQDLYTMSLPDDKPILCINSKTRDILLRIPHTYSDGIGAVGLLADLVSSMTSPKIPDFEFGNEVRNLAPVFSIAAGLPALRTEDLALGDELAASCLTAPASIGLPFLTSPPIKRYISELRISAAESVEVLQACRAQGWTVTHAVHAALIQAIAEMDSSIHDLGGAVGEAKDYATMIPFNWRHKVQPEYRLCKAAIYCGTLPAFVSKPATKKFSTLATELKEIYSSIAADERLVRAYDRWTEALLKPTITMAPATTMTPSLSSLGVVENVLPRVINDVEIEDFRLGLDRKVPFAHVFLWSWRGRTSVCVASDRGNFGEGVIDGLLKLVGRKLAVGLGVAIKEKVEH